MRCLVWDENQSIPFVSVTFTATCYCIRFLCDGIAALCHSYMLLHTSMYFEQPKFSLAISFEISFGAQPHLMAHILDACFGPLSFICSQPSSEQKQPAVSTLPAYDLLFRRHPDVTHLRLLSYRFMQRLHASASRNEEMEHLWRRPEAPQPQYKDVKYLVRRGQTTDRTLL